MAVNAKQAAKRAFVKVLLALAATYGLLLQITRDSDEFYKLSVADGGDHGPDPG